MALKQTLQQKMMQKLSPAQIQLMKLLQVPTVELEHRIQEEIEDNPALQEGSQDEPETQEEIEQEDTRSEAEKEFNVDEYIDDETPSYKTRSNNHSADDEERVIPMATGTSFHEIILSQLGLQQLTEEDTIIATQLVGNIDDSGYLRRDLENIVDDLAFSLNISTSVEKLIELLKIIQQFDPPGVGARNLQECLLIQLKKKQPSPAINYAAEILTHHFDAFTRKHYDKIMNKIGITEVELKSANEEIVKLNPKPGNSLIESTKPIQQIIPDFNLTEENGVLSITLNTRNAPELKISNTYEEMLRGYAVNKEDKSAREAAMFVKQKIDKAKWFIDAIKQRQQTLLLTMNAIMNYQKEFFLTGDETTLKPMILKDIAEIVNMDISTVSRVANSKHVQTPFGTFLLKFFFSESLSTDSGEEVSTREVKKILQNAIGAEAKNKPLTDDKLASLLKEKGYNIARRTVAKYREQLNIPVARLRKELL